jgi:hypothetical protein
VFPKRTQLKSIDYNRLIRLVQQAAVTDRRIFTERERERERRESWRGGSERRYSVRGEGVIETEFGRLEGSQAVPASPSGKGEACVQDLLNSDFLEMLELL